MLRKFREILKNKQRGAIMVFFAILVPLFLGAIGLAVDAGFLYMQKAKLQDVADATALAGAGHLNDENREAQVENAVIAFAGANGYKDKDKAVSSNFQELADKADASSVTLEENAAWKIAYAIDTGMVDKDAKNGETCDHVRVVILKRVPTFFIRMLFPEQNEVVVKAVAAAEYVKGEQVVSAGVPRIICGQIDAIYNDANSIIVPNGQNFTFAARSSGSIDYNKLPCGSKGTIFSVHVNHSTPNGWDYVNIQKRQNSWDNPYYKSDEEKKIADETNKKCDDLISETRTEAYNKASEVEKYKQGPQSGTNKRYIGPGPDGSIISNITDDDTEIDLYIKGTDIKSYGGYDKNWSLIFDRELKKVKKINTLIADKTTEWGGTLIIDSTGITYGNIYTLDNVSLYISGDSNSFQGTIYCGGGELYVGGSNNRYITDMQGSKGVALITNNGTLSLGRTKKPNWGQDYINGENVQTVKGYYEIRETGSSWHMYWGDGTGSSGSGSSSGSSSSDTTSKSRVRLVI